MKDYIHLNYDFGRPQIEDAILEWHLNHKDEFYDISTVRERLSPALSKTRAYHLRRPDLEGVKVTRTESTQNIMAMVDTPLQAKFPKLMEFVRYAGWVLAGDNGWKHLGRVFVTRLDGTQKIARHVDEGAYFEQLHRHHLVLDSAGSHFCWDNARVQLTHGEFWRVNNSIPHWVENDNPGYRTHLIFDAC